ncbi:response regulator [Parablautia muri]|uniref:Stage 0 sporulation protein A homolog n=1 Tax=Parablautia muri TaxID=2320879 RepID=A0A9X5BDX4_9FIRM|nr:response regulator [Parablautia muri]NBJ92016.1 response regulator [Parablautia muri]
MFNVLLVEDEKLEMETLRDYVDWKRLGASRVYTARNGRAALECLEAHDPDIMITDIQMPVMDGIELAKRAREEGYQCKIVFLTGYDYYDYMKSAFQVQAVDYILKPFGVDEVEGLIERICEQIGREKMAEDSIRFASGQLLVRACEGNEQKLDELSRAYFSHTAQEKAFGMLGVYGNVDEKLAVDLLKFSEVQHAFCAEQMIFVILQGYISVQDAAGRIIQAVRDNGCVAYLEGRLSLEELKNGSDILKSQRDRMFYEKPGNVNCVSSQEEDNRKRVDKDSWSEKRKELRREILSGKEESTKDALLSCLRELKGLNSAESQREAYALYLNLHNRLELEDMQLLEFMEKREEKPERKILNIGYFTGICEALWQYVKELCTYYKKQQEDSNYYVVAWVRNYVDKNYMNACRVEDMAEKINLSPNYLRSLFKIGTGQTILEYITDVRMQQACELLRDKRLKVKDVSSRAGYENVSYFSQIFTKRFGVTPNEYRKKV